MVLYDIIILGAGPAGITAAVYASRKRMSIRVISKNVGGQAALSASIENYTGYQFISGPDLARKLNDHIDSFGIAHLDNEEALSVEKAGDVFSVSTTKGNYQSKTVILALGGRPRLLKAPGEQEFKNKGITYCATCDGPLFADKNVAVIGGGNSALDAAIQLMEIASKIYVITVNDELRGDAVMLDKVKKSPKVEILANTETKEFIGDDFLRKIKVITNKTTGRIIDVEGAFIEIGWTPALIPVKSEPELKITQWGEIAVNERCETSVPGIYAAGDVTNVPEKQIIVAAGQGCIAALSAFKYLSKKK
jgi:alkyl hydroperoxide reductase subunit F